MRVVSDIRWRKMNISLRTTERNVPLRPKRVNRETRIWGLPPYHAVAGHNPDFRVCLINLRPSGCTVREVRLMKLAQVKPESYALSRTIGLRLGKFF